MRVLQAHNYYQQAGGEDTVVAAEAELLRAKGHEVIRYSVHNNAIRQMNGAAAALATIWNRETITQILALVEKQRPDLIHAHNTFPLISPSLYSAAAQAGIPVVQTLHNYRMLCPAATFYRDGHVCEDCLGRVPWPGVVHACYRSSRPASATTAAMLTLHRALGTWSRRVQVYIALSEFARSKFVAGGLPPSGVRVKPNFLSRDPGVGDGGGGYALFAGRLIGYKGITTLLEAWQEFALRVPLKIAGDGPLMEQVRAAASTRANVEVLGSCAREQVLRLIQNAAVLIFPSEWYEGMPMSLLEAFACGTPAIVSDLASLDEFALAGVNAMRFETSKATALAACVQKLFANPEELKRLRVGARNSYSESFTAEKNYPILMDIYTQAKDAVARNSAAEA